MRFQALQQAAESGDTTAQLQLGIALMTGQGVPAPDVTQGRDWLGRAAAGGNAEAGRFLGMIFLRGMDVLPDHERAVSLLSGAAEAGDAEAAWWLGCFLGGARDAYQDRVRAIQWLRQAADAGHARSMTHLAYAHLNGLEISRDVRAAHTWWTRAAQAGDPGALLALAECAAEGVAVAQNSGLARQLAQAAAEAGWEVAGEYAASLATGNAPGPGASLPAFDASARERFPAPRLEALSWQPRVMLMHGLLTTFECAEIANAAREHLMPSFIVDADGRLGKHQIRTSHEVRLRPGIRHLVIGAVETRMAAWSHFPIEHGEFPLVLRYENEQSFEQHFDYFIPEKFAMGEGPLEFGGQRIATQLVYLNESFQGGETRFDNAGLVVRPQRGMGLLFHNVGPDHNVDPLTRHTGVAVSGGVKWLLSRWIRELPFAQPAAGHPRDQYREN